MKIVETKEIFGVKHSGSDGIAAADMLKRFCQWQKRNNPDEPSPEHHDAALLLTRFVLEKDLYYKNVLIYCKNVKFFYYEICHQNCCLI